MVISFKKYKKQLQHSESVIEVQAKIMTARFTLFFYILLHNFRCVLSILLPRSHLPSTQKLQLLLRTQHDPDDLTLPSAAVCRETQTLLTWVQIVGRQSASLTISGRMDWNRCWASASSRTCQKERRGKKKLFTSEIMIELKVCENRTHAK